MVYELPTIKQTSLEKWAVKSSTELEKPRFVIVALQKGKKDKISEDASSFDSANVRNVQLYLNTTVYPYSKYHLDIEEGRYTLAYHDYCQFQKAYYGYDQSEPMINLAAYKNTPIFVIDASKQFESVQTTSIDVSLELESKTSFPADTTVYCLILYDTVFRYNPSTFEVRRET